METTYTVESPEFQQWGDMFLDNSPENLETPSALVAAAVGAIVDAAVADVQSREARKATGEKGIVKGMLQSVIREPGLQIPLLRVGALPGGIEALGGTAYLFIGTQVESAGEAVMWGYALYRLHQRLGKTISILDVVNHYGRSGLPTKARMEKCWDAQKIGGANLLDRIEGLSQQGVFDLARERIAAAGVENDAA